LIADQPAIAYPQTVALRAAHRIGFAPMVGHTQPLSQGYYRTIRPDRQRRSEGSRDLASASSGVISIFMNRMRQGSESVHEAAS
jgi:hypothetical protein